MFVKYPDLEPILRLQFNGRELIEKKIFLTEKRDGSCIGLKLEDNQLKISSRNMDVASDEIRKRVEDLKECLYIHYFLAAMKSMYDRDYIVYAELIYGGVVSPARAEKYNKRDKLVIFDIFSLTSQEFMSYNWVYQQAHQYKIPCVRCYSVYVPRDYDAVLALREYCRKLAKKHHREGIVGKVYYPERIYFKEKTDLPLLKTEKKGEESSYPDMPDEKIKRALDHAYDEVTEKYGPDAWNDKATAMPVVAKHLSTEAAEHLFRPPRNMYELYLTYKV
ncbi:MAG: hypothetical protein HXS54_06220 [Theionarchaea archaeon]|nr:hypothetical protein [Theionarchaea archaeon]DBA34854.1 TPA_asm: hypothetical protein vir521_00060 [Caudoviricetes sp. vir521]